MAARREGEQNRLGGYKRDNTVVEIHPERVKHNRLHLNGGWKWLGSFFVVCFLNSLSACLRGGRCGHGLAATQTSS